MLAAMPSVILGLWGIFVMVPFLRDGPFPWLKEILRLGRRSFAGPIYGVSMLAGGIIIAIMILPIITSVSREILRSVPNLQREAAYALGATRWEVTRIAVLCYARKGLFGAVILGLGRALGETMAVTMVIGNRPEIATSLFAPGYTLASVIANEFTEATTDLYLSALFEIGLVLFGVTMVVNLLAQLLLRSFGGTRRRRAPEPMMPDCDRIPRLAQVQERRSRRRSAAPPRCATVVPLALVFVTCSARARLAQLEFLHPTAEAGRRRRRRHGQRHRRHARAARARRRCIGVPAGVLGGVYLSEYGTAKINWSLRFVADMLNGVPSIIWGVRRSVRACVVPIALSQGFSAYAGGLALGLMMIPLIMRTTEEVLLLVPDSYREAALALGHAALADDRADRDAHGARRASSPACCSRSRASPARPRRCSSPRSAIASGISSLTDPIAALPLQIFTYAISPYEEWHRQAWAGALVLVCILFS